MLEKLGNKVFALPLVVALVLMCILGTAIAPILSASPHHIPFAIVSLDKGATNAVGSTNIGTALADTLSSGEGMPELGNSNNSNTAQTSSIDSSSDEGDGNSASNDSDSSLSEVVSFTRLESEEAARAALDNNEYYGALIIPENFTTTMMMSAVGLGEAPEVTILLNQGKNPAVSNTIQSTLSTVFLQAGIVANIETYNSYEVGGGTMGSLMMVQMMVMPLILACMVPSIILSVVAWPRKTAVTRKERTKKLLMMLVFSFILSGFAACLALCIDCIGGGMTLPIDRLFPFLWLAAFCLVVAIVGLCNLCLPLGILVAITVFALGMGTAMLPQEMLPDFWANWVYPWAPQAEIGNAIRAIVYSGSASFSVEMTSLLTSLSIGLVCMILSVFWTFNPSEKMSKAKSKLQKTTA